MDRMVAIDPGVRTFLTTYDQDGHVHEFGKGDMCRLYRLALHVDKLKSKASSASVRHAQRYRISKAIARVYDRIKNLVGDVHKKACKWLCETYNAILIPAFNSSQMVKRVSRRIETKTVRSMLHWAHYQFRQRLLFKATEYPGVTVRVVTEEYTSKTCGVCGAVHNRLGGSKVFHCPSCGWTCDRDVNGARNIMLKFLTEQSSWTSLYSPSCYDDEYLSPLDMSPTL
jgi:putative transposase